MRQSKTVEIPRAALKWMGSEDTGISSETIWHVMVGSRRSWASCPLDPADFGRCYRLLKAVPAWRARLPEVAKVYPEWKRLVDAWDELTALYEEELPNGTAPKLYARMHELEGRK